MVKWGMIVDKGRCIGCDTCTIACKSEHLTPPGMSLIRIEDTESGKYPKVKKIFTPMLCMQCNNPPCVDACPETALSKRDDGIVVVSDKLCNGTMACIPACPYDALHFLAEDAKSFYDGKPTPLELESKPNYLKGKVYKCDFCASEGTSGKVLDPACLRSCPVSVFKFGDLEDPKSNVSLTLKQGKAKQMLPEQGADPVVFYIPDGDEDSTTN